MATEKEKMLAGELYRASDPVLVAERLACRRQLRGLNDSDPGDHRTRVSVLKHLLGRYSEDCTIEPPFHCDYGSHIHLGARFYANFSCVILDCARVDIGDDVFLGPAVQIYTATHPVQAAERVTGLESAHPVTIGAGCWIGGGSIILAGVVIGEGTTVGAGSVVTRSLPAHVLAAGNPCTVRRHLDPGGVAG